MIIMLVIGLFIGLYIIGLLALAGQVPAYQKHWDAKNAEISASNAITYIALGDSTAQSIGASSPEKGYVGLIAEAIARKTGRPVHLVNLSKSGAKVEDVLNTQLPKLANLHIDDDTIITLEIGANDVARDYDTDTFTKNINQLIPLLPKQVVMSDIPFFGKGRLSSRESDVQKANAVMAEIAAKNGRQLAPLHKLTEENASLRNNALDMFHPSNRGYKNWYSAFWEQLEPTIKS